MLNVSFNCFVFNVKSLRRREVRCLAQEHSSSVEVGLELRSPPSFHTNIEGWKVCGLQGYIHADLSVLESAWK